MSTRATYPQAFTIPEDTGYEYGGPKCIECSLPMCIWDMDGYEFKRLQAQMGKSSREYLDFAQRNRAKAMMEDAARAAGVSPRTVYRWRRKDKVL